MHRSVGPSKIYHVRIQMSVVRVGRCCVRIGYWLVDEYETPLRE